MRQADHTEGNGPFAGFPCPAAARDVQDGRGGGDEKIGEAGKTVSLMLTREQDKTLRSKLGLATLLNGQAENGRHRDEGIVIKLEFNSMPPVRLLKVEEVIRMLGISKSYLNKIIQRGALRSYKFGRLRRIMLDDLLSYLEDHQEFADTPQPASKSGTTCKENL